MNTEERIEANRIQAAELAETTGNQFQAFLSVGFSREEALMLTAVVLQVIVNPFPVK